MGKNSEEQPVDLAVKPRVVYVGPVAIPKGGAAARRILGISKSLQDGGFEVLIGSGQMAEAGKTGPDLVEGVNVYSLDERTAEHLPRILKHLSYFTMGSKTKAWLSTLDPKPCAVILYSGYSPYFLQLLPWCKKNRVALIFDAVEWYDPEHMAGGKFGMYRMNFELAMRKFCVRCQGVIGITTYLTNYYKARKVQTVCVPPTLDVAAISDQRAPRADAPVLIVYAGTPGKKDLFDLMLEAVLTVDLTGERLRLRVAGLTPQQVLGYVALSSRGLTELPPSIEARGYIPNDEVISLVRDSDFSVLIRPLKTYSQAGFPTKVVESLAMGVPVICNITSDLGAYLRDGREALICAEPSVESLVAAFERAVALSPETRARMRTDARACAEASFDFRCHTAALKAFIRECTIAAVGATPSHRPDPN